MVDRVSELAAQGSALPPEDRVRLLDLLLESLQGPATDDQGDAWSVEVARRVAAHDAGEGELLDAEGVLAEAARIAP